MKVFPGVISMAVLLSALLVSPAFADDNSEAFKKLDVNGDGYITEAEALAHPELPDSFADGDEDGDGRLDMTEFAELEIADD